LADRPPDAGLQDDCRLPQGQWRSHPQVCREFVVLFRRLELFSEASVAIEGYARVWVLKFRQRRPAR
jgi:hypothetical protein